MKGFIKNKGIAHVMGILNKFMNNPGGGHWEALIGDMLTKVVTKEQLGFYQFQVVLNNKYQYENIQLKVVGCCNESISIVEDRA